MRHEGVETTWWNLDAMFNQAVCRNCLNKCNNYGIISRHLFAECDFSTTIPEHVFLSDCLGTPRPTTIPRPTI